MDSDKFVQLGFFEYKIFIPFILATSSSTANLQEQDSLHLVN